MGCKGSWRRNSIPGSGNIKADIQDHVTIVVLRTISKIESRTERA